MNRIILHLDMNSYFASVEQQANPHLRGRPVGVCEHLGGIIIAPSVEAKRAGITLGTPTWEALKKCPEIILLHTDPEKYRSVTDRFMRILNDYTDEVERYSIDEAFLDITRYCNSDYDTALMLALEIKQRMRQEIGRWVTCSIGIGPNKLVSKIAADLGEGDIDRTYVVKPNQIRHLYERLELTDVPGIGERTRKRLNKLGVFTLRQLAEYPVENLINQFGVTGYFLHQLGRFQDTAEVAAKEEPVRSIGHMYTLPKAAKNLEDLKKLLMKLCEKVGRRLRKKQARTCLIHYFHSDKEHYSYRKQRKLSEYIQDSRTIYKYAYSVLKQNLPLKRPVKIMGVSVGNLNFARSPELLLQSFKKPVWATEAMDQINDKYGEFTVFSARMLDTPDEWGKDTAGFGRIKR